MSMQLDSTNLVKCLMVHGISWSDCMPGGRNGYNYNAFDNNTILLWYGKLTTYDQPLVKSVQVKREFGANCGQDIFLWH